MKIDIDRSKFHELRTAPEEFSIQELRNLRLILRRLRFLEQQVRESGGLDSGSGGAAFAEWEVEALRWLLIEIGYLEERD